MLKLLRRFLFTFALLLVSASTAWAQAGKISGQVTDASTGNPLPGVNVVVVGTQLGATTNAQGQYTILNVPPGNQDVRASFVGYAPVTKQGVDVNIGLTSRVNFELQEQTEQLEEVTVQATEPVVKRDVSANVANLSAEDIENVPVAGVSEVISLQAGVEPGLRVRGGGLDQLSVRVDGMSMRNARDNTPFTGISYTSVEEVQVQTGGFSAEYGNVRSGLINIVTKEGPRDHYTADVLVRYGPPDEEYFGRKPNDPEAYWVKPFLTEEGTSVWNRYEQRQYPEFQGLKAAAKESDISIEQAREIFLFRHRKNLEITDADYVLDGSFGGPVPLVSDWLGDLRFFASYRGTQNPYIVPQRRSSYTDHTGQLKLTSDLAQNMKLQIHGMIAAQYGMNTNSQGWPDMFTGDMPEYPWSGTGMADNLGRDAIFAKDVWVPMDVTRELLGTRFTHTLSPSTFYEVSLQRNETNYDTGPGPQRQHDTLKVVGGIALDEAPLGWEPVGENDLISGLRMGGHWGSSRDTSEVGAWSGEFDLTSQLNDWLQVKTGLDYIYNQYNMRHGEVDSFFVHHSNPKYHWEREPSQGAAYAEGKFEFQGIVANLGLRMDYFYPGGEWYVYDPFSDIFTARFGADALDDSLATEPTERQFAVSPRLGVSFPITENSKFFFNYGHFRQMLEPNEIFSIQEINTGAVGEIGNPHHPMPLTVSYEIGYEHNLFNQLLLRTTGYYKALEDQPRDIHFEGLMGQVSYDLARPFNYEDIRGFEISLQRNRGYIRGFANYTYMVHKAGNFGFGQQLENRVEQRRFERRERNFVWTPDPQPYAHLSLEFISPPEWGPKALGLHPLGDWRVSWLANWRGGDAWTYTGAGGSRIEGVNNNVSWEDYYNVDLRLAKNLNIGGDFADVRVFADISNVFNIKHLYNNAAFEGANDFDLYMESLHLPEDVFQGEKEYMGIPGDDQPGAFREPGTPFVPIEIVKNIDEVSDPMTKPLYFVRGEEDESGTYMWYREGEFSQADQGFVDSVLEHKQYIDMPNMRSFTFLNPRRVMFGLRVSF